MNLKTEAVTGLLIFLIIISVLPLEPYRFHVVLLSTLFLGFIIFCLEVNLVANLIKILLIALLLIVIYLYQFGEINSLYDFRDVMRWAPIFLLLNYSLVNTQKFAKRIFWFICICTVFDFFVLFASIFDSLRQQFYEAATTSDMANYIDGYNRHIGIMGNPNTSALLYVIFILWTISYITFLSRSKLKIWGFVIVFINLILLISTMSRTALFCFLIVIIFTQYKFFVRHLHLLVIMAVLAIPIITQIPELVIFAETFFERFMIFSSYSAATERIDIDNDIWTNFIENNFWFGGVSNYSVTDNDYITLLMKFGIVGTVVFIATFFGKEIMNILLSRYRKFNLLHCQILGVTLLSSAAGGVIGSPGLLVISIILMRINLSTNITKLTPGSATKFCMI